MCKDAVAFLEVHALIAARAPTGTIVPAALAQIQAYALHALATQQVCHTPEAVREQPDQVRVRIVPSAPQATT